MLNQIAWNTFKNTGDINTFMELVEVDKAMDNIKNDVNKKIGSEYGSYKDKGNSNCRT